MKNHITILIIALSFFVLNGSNFKIEYILGQSVVNTINTKSFSVESGILYQERTMTLAQNDKVIPKTLTLKQNYPNPFNPSTTISFVIPKKEIVKITIYNLLGSKVAEVVNKEFKAGEHQVSFNGSFLTSGQYFYKLTAGNASKIKKMLLIK